MTRLDFLKSVGFRGPALMALLTSCVNKDDTFINALTIKSESVTESPSNPSGNSATTGTVKLTSSLAIATEVLNAITDYRLKIDLTLSSNAALLKVGGYVTQSGIVVAQSASGVLVAATQTCSHEPKRKVIFNKTEFYCTEHGARYNLSGAGLNTFARAGIAVYKVATDGNTVIIY